MSEPCTSLLCGALFLMIMGTIEIRKATVEDAEFVAMVMMEAVGHEMMELGHRPEAHLVDVCQRTDTLYTWKNAIIACVDGEKVGGLIAYDGKGYHDVKMRTFGMVREKLPFDIDAMDDETREGEYYLDSLAVIPKWRRKGIGELLFGCGMKTAREAGLLPVLACDPTNESAFKLYQKLGFEADGELFIFGETYLRMVAPL